MTLCFKDMQGLLIKSAGFTETVRFAELNFAELPNNVVSYQLAHKLLFIFLYKHVEHALACSEYFVGKLKSLIFLYASLIATDEVLTSPRC